MVDHDVAACHRGGDHVRPRLDVIGGHAVTGPVEQAALAFDDDELGPGATDASTHAEQAAREVHDVRLACGVADDGDALGEHRGHHQVLRTGDGRHVQVDASAAQPPGTRDVPVILLDHVRAHGPESLEVLLGSAHADVIAAGTGDPRLTGAGDQRSEQKQ